MDRDDRRRDYHCCLTGGVDWLCSLSVFFRTRHTGVFCIIACAVFNQPDGLRAGGAFIFHRTARLTKWSRGRCRHYCCRIGTAAGHFRTLAFTKTRRSSAGNKNRLRPDGCDCAYMGNISITRRHKGAPITGGINLQLPVLSRQARRPIYSIRESRIALITKRA